MFVAYSGSALVANVSLTVKRLNGGVEVAEKIVQKPSILRVSTHG
jgi:hypothetical protein